MSTPSPDVTGAASPAGSGAPAAGSGTPAGTGAAGGTGVPGTGSEELRPLPYDGVRSVAVGTVLWLVALLVMLPFTDDLRADGRLWWIATAAVGFVLGLLGLWVVVRRSRRLRAAGEPSGTV